MSPKHSGPKPPALSSAVEALLAHERVLPPQTELVRARALSRAREAIRQGPPAAPAPRVAGRIYVGVALGIAVVVGVAAAFQLRESPVAAAFLAPFPHLGRPTPVASAPSAATSQVPVPGSSASAAATETPGSSTRPSASSRRENGVEELQLLSRARQADARGDYAGVLAIVAEHERSYPGGRLAEEREVLRVKALVGLGRREQARRAAAKFHRQFPRSVLLHRVDEMLASPL